VIQRERVTASQAAQGSIDPLEVELGALRHRILADDIPVELDRLIHDRGELADDDVESRNALCASFPRVAERNLQ
jgi:hypothetical protein